MRSKYDPHRLAYRLKLNQDPLFWALIEQRGGIERFAANANISLDQLNVYRKQNIREITLEQVYAMAKDLQIDPLLLFNLEHEEEFRHFYIWFTIEGGYKELYHEAYEHPVFHLIKPFLPQTNWPPEVTSKTVQQDWHRWTFGHDVKLKKGYYQPLLLTPSTDLQVFYFSYQSLAKPNLDHNTYSLFFTFYNAERREQKIMCWDPFGQIKIQTIPASNCRQPFIVETYFGRDSVQFNVISLAPFDHQFHNHPMLGFSLFFGLFKKIVDRPDTLKFKLEYALDVQAVKTFMTVIKDFF